MTNSEVTYRGLVARYQKEFGMTQFTKDHQFWTLGGPHHDEFRFLDEHLDFGSRSYHTVDRGPIDNTSGIKNQSAIVTYPNTEFDDIFLHWGSVGAIAYDSNETLIGKRDDHSSKLKNLHDLVTIALNHSPQVAVHANWIVGTGVYSDPRKNEARVQEAHSKWINLFSRWFKCEHRDGCLNKREGQGWTISMHFLVTA